MPRQLQKIIFLPANKEVLYNKSQNEPISFWKWFCRDRKFFLRLMFAHTKYCCKWVFKKRYNKSFVYSESIWKAIRFGQSLGYKIILYPENESDLNTIEFYEAVQLMHKKKLTIGLLAGNSISDFQNAIVQYNINPHNSVFVSKDYTLVKHLLKIYFPRNYLRKNKLYFKLPLGFKIIYWNEKQFGKGTSLIQWNAIENLYTALRNHHELSHYIYSSGFYPTLYDKIIYIEQAFNEPVNQFISKNLQWLQDQSKLKGCEFIYLPAIIENKLNSDYLIEYARYSYPDFTQDFTTNFLSYFNGLSTLEITELLLELLNLPAFKTPALLRNRESVTISDPGEYSYISIDETKDLQKQFELYFQKYLQKTLDTSTVKYSKVKFSDDGKVDSRFEAESQKIADDVIKKIEYLKKQGMNALLAEIALRLLDGSDEKVIHGKTSGKIPKQLNVLSQELSSLKIEWTSKYNFQILLPDYGNTIVEMPRLPKALYYFFLNHPEGIMLNSMADYRDELLSIYSRISNKSDKKEIQENINRLVDPFDNSLNVNCSRIKNAFVKLVNDDLAKNYYITGERGNPKKIILPNHYIKIIHNH